MTIAPRPEEQELFDILWGMGGELGREKLRKCDNMKAGVDMFIRTSVLQPKIAAAFPGMTAEQILASTKPVEQSAPVDNDVAEARRIQKEALNDPTLLFVPDNLKLFARLRVSNEPIYNEIKASWEGKIAVDKIIDFGLEVAEEVFKLTHPGETPYWEKNMAKWKAQEAAKVDKVDDVTKARRI